MSKSRFGMHMIDDVVACCIRSEARRVSCPEYLAMGIAGAESGWDPNAVGDNGQSYGLFQLNIAGGQGTDYTGEPQLLLNPRLNARIAMQAIVKAAWMCGNQGKEGTDYVACVAVNSGHPGHISTSDPRVQKIVRITCECIFNSDGSWAHWPDFHESVCAAIVIPATPAPPTPTPTPG